MSLRSIRRTKWAATPPRKPIRARPPLRPSARIQASKMGKAHPLRWRIRYFFKFCYQRNCRLAVVSVNGGCSFIFIHIQTPETEQPPSLSKPEVCDEQVHIIIDSKGPEVPKIQVESSDVANGSLKTQSPLDSPAPTPSPSSDTTPVSTPRAGQNGTITKGLPERRTSVGGTPETSSAYINGGIFSKRSSYASSMASESMDLSINRENMSISSRVS